MHITIFLIHYESVFFSPRQGIVTSSSIYSVPSNLHGNLSTNILFILADVMKHRFVEVFTKYLLKTINQTPG